MILAQSAERAHLPRRRPPRLLSRPRPPRQQLHRRRTWFLLQFVWPGCPPLDRLGHASTAPAFPRRGQRRYLASPRPISLGYGGRVELRHLRYALALAEHQHFGRAAEAVGIAQPPLSKQIAALEREVGTALFDRTPRGVYPTAAGEAFLAR